MSKEFSEHSSPLSDTNAIQKCNRIAEDLFAFCKSHHREETKDVEVVWRHLQGLSGHAVVYKLVTHPLTDDVVSQKNKFHSCYDVWREIQTRHDEYHLSWWQKGNLFRVCLPLRGKRQFLQDFVSHFAHLMRLKEGEALIEVLCFLYKTPSADHQTQKVLSRFIHLLETEL